jgi:hypothetical protein
MRASNSQWQLGEADPNHSGTESDVFEHESALKRRGMIDNRVFAEDETSPARLACNGTTIGNGAEW